MKSIEESISWEDGAGFDFKRCRPGMAFLIRSEDGQENEEVCYFVGLDPMRDDYYVFVKEAKTGYFSVKEKRLDSLLRFPPEDLVKWPESNLDELDKKVLMNIGYIAGYAVTLVRVVSAGINKFITRVF